MRAAQCRDDVGVQMRVTGDLVGVFECVQEFSERGQAAGDQIAEFDVALAPNHDGGADLDKRMEIVKLSVAENVGD
jgi:hypothetical protein